MVKYYLPKIKEIEINNYDLYKCPINIVFSEKLNLIFGTNGLGKTTLLNIIQYSIIGPYTGKIRSRNWKDHQKLKRPMHDKNYFRNRMNNKLEEAEVKIKFTLGKDAYEVWHSLYEHKLKKFILNEQEIVGDIKSYDTYEKKYFGQNENNLDNYLIDKYHRNIEKSSNFPDINSFILMITEMMFFTEARDLAFWEQDMCKSILSKFMPKDKYFEYDKVQKLVKKYDSQARLTSYKMSMIKDFLGEDFAKKTNTTQEYSLEDLDNVNKQIDSSKSRIEKIEQAINSTEKEISQNRFENEQISKRITDVEEKWYKNIFPDNYQRKFNRYVPVILSGKCPFCGENHRDVKVDVTKCFFCQSDIDIKERANLDELEIERRNLEFDHKRIKNNYILLKKEKIELKSELSNEELDFQDLIQKQHLIKQHLDIKDDDNIAKYQELEQKKQKYIDLYNKAKAQEGQLALEIDECIKGVFKEYCQTFKKYAYSFLGNDTNIELILNGKMEDAFFSFRLNGTERESEESLSESQRIFVDMAYRLATLEFFHNDSYFISETPDSTLDFMFEQNAVKTFSYFIDSGNTLFASANARNSQLINRLVKQYQNDYKLINLLEISNLTNENTIKNTKIDAYHFLEE